MKLKQKNRQIEGISPFHCLSHICKQTHIFFIETVSESCQIAWSFVLLSRIFSAFVKIKNYFNLEFLPKLQGYLHCLA